MTRNHLAGLVALLLVVGACGDDDSGTGSSTTTSATTTSAGGDTTVTTAPVDTRPLADLASLPAEDPFFGTGFHAMTLLDDSGTAATSVEPLVGSVAGANLLGLGTMDPYPVMSGVGADMVVVVAWVHNPQADVLPDPSAVVLYQRGADGWEVLASISDTIVLGFLETTTDFAAWKPATGTPYARTTVRSLDWDGSAHFIADVQVLDYPGNTTEFRAEVECTLGGTLESVLLSDDGVLRPGDTGPAVEALEQDLMSIGYHGPPANGVYDDETTAWVRRFQRDYRLTVDGKVGPQTRAVIDQVAAGLSDIVMAYGEGVGGVSFGSTPEAAVPALVAALGSFDYSVGWEMGACGPTPPYGGWEWYKVTWGGFTAWFTERSGSRQFDGWEITDLNGIPSNLYIAGGFGPATTWSDVAAQGGVYDPFYGWWSAFDLGYGLGEFDVAPSNPPAGSAQVKGFGVGSAAVLYDC